jgi:hypothetical protein
VYRNPLHRLIDSVGGLALMEHIYKCGSCKMRERYCEGGERLWIFSDCRFRIILVQAKHMYKRAKNLDAADEKEDEEYVDDTDDNSETEASTEHDDDDSSDDGDDMEGEDGSASNQETRDGAVGGATECKKSGSVESRQAGSMATNPAMAKGKRRAEAEAEAVDDEYPQARKSLRIRRRLECNAREKGILIPSEVSVLKAKGTGKSDKEVTNAQEAIMRSIEEANASRRKNVSFSNIERLQPAPVWNEVVTGPTTSRFVRSVLMEETRARSESQDSHTSHVSRLQCWAQQVSSSSGPRSNSSSSYTSGSHSEPEEHAEKIFISWANRTEPTEPDAVVEVAEVMEATRYGMEEEAEQMGVRAEPTGRVAEMGSSTVAMLCPDVRGGEISSEDPPDNERGKTRESRVRNRRKKHKRRRSGQGSSTEEADNDPEEERDAVGEKGVAMGR